MATKIAKTNEQYLFKPPDSDSNKTTHAVLKLIKTLANIKKKKATIVAKILTNLL